MRKVLLLIATIMVVGGCGFYDNDRRKELTELLSKEPANVDEVIETLMSCSSGAYGSTCPGGLTPLQFAFSMEYVDVAEFLVARVKFSPKEKARHKKRLVHIALDTAVAVNAKINPKPALLRLAVKAGADFDVLDHEGKAPLRKLLDTTATVDHGLVQLLVDLGAKVNARDEHGNTPMHYLAKKGNIVLVKLFLDKGADKNALNKYGQTPMFMSAANDHYLLTKFFIDIGADVNRGKLSPLYASARYCHERIAKMLLKNHASYNGGKKVELTPLFGAAVGKCGKIGAVLISKGAIFRPT